MWPGAVLGNLGSVAGEVGVPSQLAPAANDLNDSVKAESFYPAGPTSDTYPPRAPSSGALEMSAYSGSDQSWAKAGITDASVPGLFDLQSVQGSTTATAASIANSTASGTFSSLSLLGGLVQIGASSSTASAQSDGAHPNGTSTTDMGAITIAGERVSVGAGGLVVGPVSADLSGLLGAGTSAVNELVSVLNLKMALLPEAQTNQGSADTITSGGLSVSFSLPSNLSASLDCNALPSQLAQLNLLCQTPDELEGLNFTFTLGRVTASAFAALPFAVPSGVLGPLPGLTSPFVPTTVGVTGTTAVPAQPVPMTTPRSPTSATSNTAIVRRSTGLLSVALSSPGAQACSPS